MTEHNLPEKDDAPWLDTRYDGFMTHEEMLEEAKRREKIDNIVKEAIDKNGPALKQLAETERGDLIDLAIQELGWIVMGGQDGREFTSSILFIKDVLERLR